MALSGDDVCDLVAIIDDLVDGYAGGYGVRVATLEWALGGDPVKLALVERARRDCAARRFPAHPGLGKSITEWSRDEP
jgi:hypothetical protein